MTHHLPTAGLGRRGFLAAGAFALANVERLRAAAGIGSDTALRNQGAPMKCFAPALLALLVLPLVTTARDDTLPDGWREVTGGYKNRAYVVWYPKGGKLTNDEDSIVSKDFGQIRIYRSVLQRKDGSLLATSQILLPPKLVKAPPKVRQDFFRDMFLQEFDGKLVEEKKTKLGTMAGREYVVKTSKGMARYVVLGTGVQIFRVAFVGTKDQLESKDTQTFFDSFKRTPQTTDAAAPKADSPSPKKDE
jgi:hypothetical protein